MIDVLRPWFIAALFVAPLVVYLFLLTRVCIRNAGALRTLALRVHNSFIFTCPDRLEAIEGLEQIEQGSPELERAALENLAAFAAQFRPDWIIGVNSGGRLVSTDVALTIGLSLERCMYMRHDSEEHLTQFWANSEPRLRGKILVVDDISRSGETLGAIKDLLMSYNDTDAIRVEAVRFAVLVLDATARSYKTDFAPDFAAYATVDPSYRFSWSELTEEIKREFIQTPLDAIRNDLFAPAEAFGPKESRLIEDAEFVSEQVSHYVGVRLRRAG